MQGYYAAFTRVAFARGPDDILLQSGWIYVRMSDQRDYAGCSVERLIIPFRPLISQFLSRAIASPFAFAIVERMKESAGTLLYRRASNGSIEVLLIHPSGNYNRKAPWGIPKGLVDPGENPEQTARRETLEETGVVAGELVDLSSIVYQKSRKRVHAFAGEAPSDAEPRVASWEVDQATFLSLDEARQRIHPDQAPFLDRLLAVLER